MMTPRADTALLIFAALAASAASAAPAAAQGQCAGWQDPVRAPNLSSAEIDESSGLAVSRVNPGKLWTHNDSGDEARLFLFDTEGQLHATVKLDGVSARDWEDMAVGPCGVSGSPDAERSCVYVADIGDNLEVLDTVVVHRFEEPVIGPTTTTRVVSEVESLRFSYPDGARDAETLMVHPSGRLFVADKVSGGTFRIYEVPASFGETVEATQIASHSLDETGRVANLVTAGDISADGSTAVLRSYSNFYTFCGPADDPIALFGATPRVDLSAPTFQGEALAYDSVGQRVWITSELAPAPLFYHQRVGTMPADGADGADAGAESGADTGTESADAGATNNSGDAEASPDETPASGSKKGGCQSAGAGSAGAGSLALLLFALAWLRTSRRSARRRRTSCAPLS